MFRTPKVGTRALAGVATIATVTGLTLPLMATAASAAVSSITVDSSSDKQVAVSTSIDLDVTVTHTVGDTTPIRFAIVSGPDADKGGNGNLVSDGDCAVDTAVDPTHTTYDCSFAGNSTAGTDVVRVFASVNTTVEAGEASADATVVKYGAPAGLSINPASDSAAAGTCNAYTVTLTDSGGRAVPGATVDLEGSLTGTPGTRDLTFCDPGTTNPTSSDAGGDTVTGAGTITGSTDATDANGKATFGIISNQPGGAQVRAYFDTNASTTYNAGEPTAIGTKTFTAGGPVGNAAQDAVASLTVTPPSQTGFTGEAVDYTVVAKNGAGDTTPNVSVSYAITGANPASGTIATKTDNSGSVDFSYTPAVAGTDTITFFVNQTAGATAGADANEPKATGTTTVQAAPVGNTIVLTCAGTAADFGDDDCVQPLTNKTETFTALVTKAGQPVAGLLIRFRAHNDGTPGLPDEITGTATTDAAGKAVYVLNDPAAVDGTFDHVIATIAGQAAAATDNAWVTFQKAVASTLTLTPAETTTQTGTSSAFVANVTDQFEVAVAGVNVDFSIAGRNVGVNGPALLNKTTDASGNAALTYADTGVIANSGTDTITAWADLNGDDTNNDGVADTAINHFITEPATAGSVDLDVTGAGVCGVTTTEPTNDANTAPGYAPGTGTNTVCALVKTAGGVLLKGKNVTFTLSGVGNFAKADGTALTSPQTVTTDSNGVALIRVVSTKAGAQNITATIDGKSDAGTVTYRAALTSEARNIDLKPEAGNIAPGTAVELTALVTDKFGNPVQGITVDFTETGAGQFGNGTSSQSGVTGATGTVTVTVTSAAGSTGTESVTAAINTPGATQCGAAAIVGPPAYTAGNCTDTEDYTYKSSVAPKISVSPTALNIGQYATVVVTGTPGDAVQLLAYSRPSTTYTVVRNGTIGSNGQYVTKVGPRTNTRIYAKTAGGNSTSAVISVRPAESLFGQAQGKVGKFNGGIVPGHAGVTVRLFTVKNGVRSSSPVGTAVTDANGKWTYSRTFAATGPVTFISQTLSDLTSLAGQSNRITITFS